MSFCIALCRINWSDLSNTQPSRKVDAATGPPGLVAGGSAGDAAGGDETIKKEEEDDEDDEDDEDEDDDDDDGDGGGGGGIYQRAMGDGTENCCNLLWQGNLPKRIFAGFKFQEAKSSQVARKVLEAKQVGHYWDMVRQADSALDAAAVF
jgi:hypothetical protein